MIHIVPVKGYEPEVEAAVKVLEAAGWARLLLHYEDGSLLLRPLRKEEVASYKKVREEREKRNAT